MSKKILVVDDDVQLVDALQIRLEAKGYEVVTAYDGQKALEKVQNQMPDLVILDLMMPKLSGEDVCREIRKDEKAANLPIIMLTGKSSDIDKVVGEVIGASCYMSKPFEDDELLEKINELLT